MPYTDNKSKTIKKLIQQAFEEIKSEPNFDEDFRDANLTEDELKQEIERKINEIWKSAGVEVMASKYDTLEESLKNQESELKKEFPSFKTSASSSSNEATRLANEATRLTEVIRANFQITKASSEVPSGGAETQTTEQANQQLKERELAIISVREDLNSLGKEIDSSLLQEIKETIRLTINSKIKPNYDTRLKILDAPGLAEVLDPSRTIDTGAKASLLYMLNSMQGGSIGIAGSRGAGKSTLIHMCCGTKRIINDIKGTKILPILTSAPVQYESRDFILYLFSAVCQRVLDPNDTEDNLQEPPEVEGFSYPYLKNPVISKFLTAAPKTLYYFGGLLIILSVLIALTLSLIAKPSPGTQTAQEAQQLEAQTASPPASPTPTPSPTAARESFIIATVKVLEIKPGTLLIWGIFLALSGLAISMIRRGFTEIIFFPHSYEEFAAGSDEQRQEWFVTAEKIQLPQAKRAYLTRRLSEYEHRRKAEAGLSTIQKKAKYWLKEIKFQQSFTSGWSGALKLPVGLEGGVNRAVTMAQRQMSNPEVVAAFVKFLRSVTDEYKVIIGIDELDKIESDEDAQKFLNEIKSIFGIPNCFYLISVSENAMSNFERRGLPFRDVFDSSFDNVVYVDYLNHRTAKHLLERRIIGKPLPFIYLSYCMSGGLPRDLIRNFRNLLELNQKTSTEGSNGEDLTTLGQAIVNAEIKAKVRAIAALAKKIELEPDVSRFIEMLFRIENQPLSGSTLLTVVQELLQWHAARTFTPEATEDEKAEAIKCRRIDQLSKELGSYIYFLATVLQFFNNTLNETELRTVAANGELDMLAKSRQLMSINPNSTVSLLNQFRTSRMWAITHPSAQNSLPASIN
ncbi:MAG TPA: P-loop NTPase fold protein [Pyrinomonadaceae bacterium]|nr:P-loop NTPase fold protein [Pyrinomonadaceae bacterium]